MRRVRRAGLVAVFMAFALSGCLEMSQYPAWADSGHDGTPENPPTHAGLDSDRLAGNAPTMTGPLRAGVWPTQVA